LFVFHWCTVSLVGQWIEEAKSKLSNPGAVYPYHGHSRNRDPTILALNSIVVTTYDVLVSDNSFHRNHSIDPDSYCPPCERVRWWRIICDESHVLRSGTGKLEATLNLVGDNKWLVTGTSILFEIVSNVSIASHAATSPQEHRQMLARQT